MKSNTGVLRGDRADERGAALVEFAFVLPLLLMLLLGTVTGGLTYSRRLSIENAAREAARYGATLSVETNLNSWLDDVAAVAVGAATGDLDLGVAGRTICVAYVHPSGADPLDTTTSLTIDPLGVRAYGSHPCYSDGRPGTERRVQVALERASTLDALLLTRNLTLAAQTTNRFERGGP
jgi:hypothetical protein